MDVQSLLVQDLNRPLNCTFLRSERKKFDRKMEDVKRSKNWRNFLIYYCELAGVKKECYG